MSGMEIASTLLVIAVFYFRATKKLSFPNWRDVPFFKPMLAFGSIAVLGILLSDTTLNEKRYDIGRMRFFLTYFALFVSFKLLNDHRSWRRALLATTLVISIYGFVQHFIAIDLVRPEGKKVLLYALQDEKIGPVVVGTFNHHLTFSNVYFFFACLFFALGVGAKKRLLSCFGIFLFVLVVWTHSRIALLAIPFALIPISVFLLGRKRAFLEFCLACAILAGLLLATPSLRERVERTFSQGQEISYAPRLRLWHAQWEMFKAHPLIGIGWNTNERKAKEYVDRLYPNQEKPFYGHAHSTLLQILATTGILGLLAFLWMWGAVFQSVVKSIRRTTGEKRAIAVGVFSAFIGFWIQGLTQWNFGDAEVAHSVVFFWGLAAWLEVQPS